MREKFDLSKAIPAAWDYCWKDNLKQRKRKNMYRPGSTYYLTAGDIVNQVRQFAQDQADGKPWGAGGRAWGRPTVLVRVYAGRNLLGLVRDWLLHSGKVVGHNFGRGHISGMRFRPKGEPLSEAEQVTLNQKAQRKDKPPLKHYAESHYKLLCQKKARCLWSRGGRRGVLTTKVAAEVTCPRCIKLLSSATVRKSLLIQPAEDSHDYH